MKKSFSLILNDIKDLINIHIPLLCLKNIKFQNILLSISIFKLPEIKAAEVDRCSIIVNLFETYRTRERTKAQHIQTMGEHGSVRRVIVFCYA